MNQRIGTQVEEDNSWPTYKLIAGVSLRNIRVSGKPKTKTLSLGCTTPLSRFVTEWRPVFFESCSSVPDGGSYRKSAWGTADRKLRRPSGGPEFNRMAIS